MAVCQFCGTRFKVDLDGVAPKLAKDTRPPVQEPEPKEDFYSQFQPGADQPAEPEPEPLPVQPPAYTPAPSYQPEPTTFGSNQQAPGRRIWLIVALVVGAVVIGSCVCLVLVSQGIISLFQ
jgi:hypothetical protein